MYYYIECEWYMPCAYGFVPWPPSSFTVWKL